MTADKLVADNCTCAWAPREHCEDHHAEPTTATPKGPLMTTPYRFPIESYAAAILVVRRAEADGAITPAEALERRAQLWRLALVHPDVEPVRDFAYGAAVGRQDRERWIEAQRHGDTISLPCGIDGSTDWGRGYAWGWDQHRAADPHDPPVPAHPWDGLVDRGEERS